MPANVTATGDDALTIDMVEKFTFCPRLFHLMYVDGLWADNEYTTEGRAVHRLVDKVSHLLPEVPPEENFENKAPKITHSIPLSSLRLGITGKLDCAVTEGEEAVPIETKRGKVPNNTARCYPTHQIQLMLQGLLLRENGYQVSHGMIYFSGSRQRITVPFTEELEQKALTTIKKVKEAVRLVILPDPLEDDPRCNGCSLAPICLPDETLALRSLSPTEVGNESKVSDEVSAARRFILPRVSEVPLYVQEQGARVGKDKLSLTVTAAGEELTRVRVRDISQVVLCGNIQITTQTVHFLCENEIPVVYLSSGMWFYGVTHGFGLRNAYDRAAQFAFAAEPASCLEFARGLVRDKGLNQRTLLRRNAPESSEKKEALSSINNALFELEKADSLASLLGYEGLIARFYFKEFASLLKGGKYTTSWDFEARNRRPPKDPVNAMLSFAYSLLAKECACALFAEGLDPYWGFYHQPRHGRPALALDIMEPLRPLVADSAVITAINTSMVRDSDFEINPSGCAMSDRARKALLKAYEGRLDQLVTHPLFEYRCSWRSVIRLQARLLSRYLRKDIPSYQNIVTR